MTAVAELASSVGTVAACAALGVSRATMLPQTIVEGGDGEAACDQSEGSRCR